ncbi:MAG: FAD binding domain-containing protein [Firmicutes bacterium]|nr:FAD binding domain-containing protein [Bacillota bacterium]
MIPWPVHYYRPDQWADALDLYQQLTRAGRSPRYYLGGTEIITMARTDSQPVSDLIDLKGIPEIMAHGQDGDWLYWGAGLSLARVAELDAWPVLTATADRVADHTSREQITLGGNCLSIMPYKEALVPFMLPDRVMIEVATSQGLMTVPLHDRFDGSWHLAPGEFLLSLRVLKEEARSLVFRSYKMTRLDWVDYPLVTVVVVRDPDGQIRAGFSGWGPHPLVSSQVNALLSDRSATPAARAAAAIAAMPTPALDDLHASRAYRTFVTQHTLALIIRELEE